MNQIIVQKKYANRRLDKFLAQKFPRYSRSYLQKNIKAGKITVNGKAEKADYKIKTRDRIEVAIKPLEKISLTPDRSIKLDIVYEDNDLILINKPSGLVVHAGIKHPQNTLVNALIAYYPKIETVGDDPRLRPGIVHRLDKDASGLMVVAKNNQTFEHLKKQFQQRKVEKIYICLVWDKFKKKKGKIDLPIARNPQNPAKMVVVRDPKNALAKKNKSALTEFEVIRQFGPVDSMNNGIDRTALVRVYLRTGRRHQIRVHFKSIGHPLVNDSLYGERKQCFLGSGRIFLHATKLTFLSCLGKKLEFTSPLPRELEKILQLIAKN